MARAPRSLVPKSSGSGVSRLSYQQGYQKGNRGSAAAGGAVPGADAVSMDTKVGRAGKPKVGAGGGINVSYGDTLPIGDLADINAVATGKPPKSNYAKPRVRGTPPLADARPYAKGK